MGNIQQEQVKKAFCYQKLFWPFTVWINCSSDLKNFASFQPSASNFTSFSWSLEQFFLTVGQNNFGNKIPLFWSDQFLLFFRIANPAWRTLWWKCYLHRYIYIIFSCVRLGRQIETYLFRKVFFFFKIRSMLGFSENLSISVDVAKY